MHQNNRKAMLRAHTGHRQHSKSDPYFSQNFHLIYCYSSNVSSHKNWYRQDKIAHSVKYQKL